MSGCGHKVIQQFVEWNNRINLITWLSIKIIVKKKVQVTTSSL